MGCSAVGTENSFTITFELVPARTSRGKTINKILQFAREAADDRLLNALSITDNAGGHPALSPKVLGREINELGIEPIIHFSCKDKNRNIIESELFELDRLGLKNLLVITGDYPGYGSTGNAKPVFDLDSVQVLRMISDMNMGFILDNRTAHGGTRLSPTSFYAGCAVSPFKSLESELIPQYLKLKRKVAAGASYVITQMGFDIRKYDELRRFMNAEGLKIPLLGTVFIPTIQSARILHKGVVSGCILPSRLLELMEQEATLKDHGVSARLERAARLMAILKGLGYDGVHLSGPDLQYAHVSRIIERANEVGEDWMQFAGDFLYPDEWEFWYFKKDHKTGLNQDEPNIRSVAALSMGDLLSLNFGRFVHSLAFVPTTAFYEQMCRVARRVDGSYFEKPCTSFEYMVKRWLYDCRHCGDCTLEEMGFVCPQSQCAKFLLNGPCGGSRDGWCEVWPEKKRCIYVRIYERFHSLGEEKRLSGPLLPPPDWALHGTASWLNFYLGKDHHKSSRVACQHDKITGTGDEPIKKKRVESSPPKENR